MPPADPDEAPEPPLDPAVERVQARLRRLLLISGGTMALGLIAVFSAILYRVVKDGSPPAPAGIAAPALPGAPGLRSAAPLAAAVPMPPGARLLSVTPFGGQLLVAIEAPGGGLVLVVDPETLAVLRRLELTGPR